ncbi:TIGR03086 family metal-binding protein [Nocardioides coralli]|uniref:TIGR03086 family metal-binding protein n=1 Tax=Nocardioides coralli TaxID=2872154 RepID=UPI001CA3CFE0|nr:TIGR03086 family metal-binding protein [Nocardioides coralli]QZY28606.1 TIGR03086 family protein [Nocardioides coralli]
MPDPADRHRRHAGTFSTLVSGTGDWDAPAPVAGWTARDVVDHLVGWLPGFLAAGADVRLPAGPSVADDPAGAWDAQVRSVQRLLDDPDSAEIPFADPHTGELPLDQAIDLFYTSDVFLHAWDLARATGQSLHLDADECAAMLAGMEPYDELMRSSGQYGPRVAVADDACVQDRLLGFIGRDPAWSAPRG